MDMVFENLGLCHIGAKIFKDLDFHTKLSCRLVRKSLNNMFEKEAFKLNFEEFLQQIKIYEFKSDLLSWSEFFEQSREKIPTLILNSYLQNLIRVRTSLIFGTPLTAFASIGNYNIVDLILCSKSMSWKGWHKEHSEAFKCAAKYGHINVVKCFTKSFPISIPLTDHKLAFYLATRNGHLEVVKFLSVGKEPLFWSPLNFTNLTLVLLIFLQAFLQNYL